MVSADMVRADSPAFSIALSSASAFMTVASMPIMSPVARATPFSDTFTPRKILPPPTTTAIATPSCWEAVRSAAIRDRKSTRLNSSHQIISYAVFCLKKKKKTEHHFKRYFHQGVVATLNTDCPLTDCITLTDEYFLAHAVLGHSPDYTTRMVVNSCET